MSRAKTASTGISFGGLLTVLFIGLKLAHIINWSWIWVLAPLWFPIALLCSIVLVFGVFAIVGYAVKNAEV